MGKRGKKGKQEVFANPAKAVESTDQMEENKQPNQNDESNYQTADENQQDR
jgi:hypothetical protein